MPRPVTLFTGQWADLPLDDLMPKARAMGFDGLELACWGDHVDVPRAAADAAHARRIRERLAAHGLALFAVSNHLVGQCVCDPIDERHRSIVPPEVWGDGSPEGVRTRAAERLMQTADAAKNMGVAVVNGFTGSPVWHKLYFFPPTSAAEIDAGYREFARRFRPILDHFAARGVRFALEVHPTEIAYDTITARRALEALDHHPAFGFNFDPSHLVWQGVDPARFIDAFPDRVFHAHMKDAKRRPGGEASILGSHLPFGDPRRGWDFVSVGRGEVNFDEIIRALNRAGYQGPLSVEWEDSAMHREHGAAESARHVRSVDFPAANAAFDAAFNR